MAQGDFFTKSAVLSSGGELIVDGSTAETGAVELHTFASEDAINVFKEVDTGGDGSFDIAIGISSPSGGIHSQKNKIEVSSSKDMRLRIVETSADVNGVHVTGIEVAD
jgi:hypothetical protein